MTTIEKTEKILFNKNDFIVKKIAKNNFSLDFFIENQNFILSSMINFDLIKLFYDLNPDIYEKVILEKQNETQCVAIFLLKHLFKDLGVSQKYSHFNIIKTVSKDKIIFESKTITNIKPEIIPSNVELLNSIANCHCDIITPHKIHFTIFIEINNEIKLPEIIEKVVGNILYKIFKRIKQFIENIVINK